MATTTKRGLTTARRPLAFNGSTDYASPVNPPVAYQFHFALRNISPRIWRRIELSADHSLADLHRVIQVSFGWSDEYQHRFCIRHHRLGVFRPGGLLLFGNPAKMTLARFAFRDNERFTYEYNF